MNLIFDLDNDLISVILSRLLLMWFCQKKRYLGKLSKVSHSARGENLFLDTNQEKGSAAKQLADKLDAFIFQL